MAETASAAVKVNSPIPIDQKVELNLIAVGTSDGTQQATAFGNPSQRSYIESQIDSVWAQAGIDVELSSKLTPYQDDFAFDGRPNDYSLASGNTRPFNDLYKILSDGDLAGVGSPSSSIVDVYFVNVVPCWGERGYYQTNGCARGNRGGFVFYLGEGMLTSTRNMDIVAGVFSHELGHNLGLTHVSDKSNLMNPTIYNGRLTPAQVDLVRQNNSGLLSPIPEPSSVLLLILSSLFAFNRKRD